MTVVATSAAAGTAEDGYDRYDAFFHAPPLLTVEWRDAETPAVGVLVINSLRGGGAGGGTRMRHFPRADDPEAVDVAAIREEALFLAKTMEIKFRVSGPDIGGAKSVIHFDPADPRKREVLRRWFSAIAPYLRHHYGTGGDLNVDEIKDVVPLTGEVGLGHPQEGIVAGHVGASGERKARILENLRTGVTVPVDLPDVPGVRLKLADLITGYGVVEATAAYVEGIGGSLADQRVMVEGFGAVGGSAAYYYHAAGARVVGILCKEGPDFLWAVDPDGLDVPALLADRRGTLLPARCSRGPSAEPFWEAGADCFAPAARSRAIGPATLDRLRASGVSILACGANNPFDDPVPGDLAVERRADRQLAVLPDFVANCGMARAFAYLMSDSVDLGPEAIFADAKDTIHRAVRRILGGERPRTGILERALATFVPSP